jgi:uncharacterized protein
MQVGQGGLTMACKKGFLSSSHAPMKDKNFYLNFLDEIFGQLKPLAKLLKTESGYYLYDSGTNKILGCRKQIFELLQDLFIKDVSKAVEDFVSQYCQQEFLSAAEEIIEAINTEKILLLKKATNYGLSDHFKDFRKVLSTSIKGMNLEVTCECPLRCTYCIYQDHYRDKRNYSNKSMSLETAQKAIEFLKKHSINSDTIMLGFYGGEPLMRFSFIKDCVEYSKNILKDKKLKFNMTTNAVLVTPEIAEYLFKEGFSILVSLDGPEKIHDRYRIDKNGKGSFKRTINGLKILAEKYWEIKKGIISLNVVYTPPYSEEKINLINNFVKELNWMPVVNVLTNYPNPHSIPIGMFSEYDLKQDKTIMQWAIDKFKTEFEKSDSMVKGQIEKKFAKFIQRPVLKEPFDSFYFNACCLPGQRKSHITTDGSIKICEKISSNSPSIGSVYSEFDFETIEKVYINEYAEKSIEICSGCWGIRLCGVCYIQAFNDQGEFDINRKNIYCHYSLNSLENSLKNFAGLIEKNSRKLDYLYQYEIT